MSDYGRRNGSSIVKSAITGAAISAVLTFAVLAIPGEVKSHQLPGRIDVRLGIVLCLIAAGVVGIAGAFVGIIASLSRFTIIGALFGFALFSVFGMHMANNSRTPSLSATHGPIGYSILTGTIGYFAGAIAGFVAQSSKRSKFQALVHLVMLLAPASACLVVWETFDLRATLDECRILQLGGDITWNDLKNPKGYYEVDFSANGNTITDAHLQQLVPPLARIPRLDLYLMGSPITDEGIRELYGLDNLVRIHLARTKVTSAGVSELKQRLPLVVIDLDDSLIWER